MAVLVELTHRVAGRTMYLCLHKRPGRVTLRWRNTGASAPHLPWAAAAERIAQFERSDPRLAAWYREADRQARLLNLEEKTAGATLRRARAALGLGQLTID